MSTEFDALTSLSDWSAKLSELLSAARSAAEQPDDVRFAVARRLTDFIAHSYPATPEIHRLDEVASAAARALSERVSNDAMERIASRTALLEILAGELDTIRSRAESAQVPSAESIAGLAARLVATADDARALARFRAESAKDPNDFRHKVESLVGTLDQLRAAFLSLSSRPEPRSESSGTFVPEAPRGNL